MPSSACKKKTVRMQEDRRYGGDVRRPLQPACLGHGDRDRGVCAATGRVAVAHAGLAFFFFFNDTATTEIYTLSLHDALPISPPPPPPAPIARVALVNNPGYG